ncbi:AsmA family protein [Methylovirgula sp. 4M-Z18]|uniref:AsmA family protein n=1 Tax=Methylovirgula sp. 4M-Z18 TaxID=2293567 RepID=UPI001314A865|nr:AsmA family protein [Methylovirgula sp. 4M-Z18]
MALKQLKWLILAGLILVAGGFFAPWENFTRNLQKHLFAQIYQLSGLNMDAQGEVALELAPHPGLRLTDVTLHDRFDAIHVDAPAMRARLRLGPLLFGRLEFDAFMLRKPDIHIDARRLILARADLANASRQLTDPAERIGKILIRSGTVSIFKDSAIPDTVVRDITAAVDWPKLGAPAAFSGHARWHELTGDLSGWVENPQGLMQGAASNAILRVHTPIAWTTYEGEISTAVNAQILGKISGKITDLPRLLENFHVMLPVPDMVQNLDFSGDLHGLRHEVSLVNASLQLDKVAYTGSMVLTGERGKPHLSATLSTDWLAFSPATGSSASPAPLQSISEQSKAFIANLFRDMRHADLDVRLFATTALFGPVKLQDAAISVLSNSDQLEISLGETQGYGGIVKFKSVIRSDGDRVSVEGSASATDLNSQNLAQDLAYTPSISGLLSGQMTWQTTGTSLAEWANNVAGTGQVSINQGEIGGFDTELALRHLADRSLGELLESHGGRTSFESLAAAFQLSGEDIRFQNGTLTSPTFAGAFAGSVNLVDGQCRISAQAHPLHAAPADPQLSLDITGPWNRPKIHPDMVK